MEIRGDVLTDKENAGAALLDAYKEVEGSEPIYAVGISHYRGLHYVRGVFSLETGSTAPAERPDDPPGKPRHNPRGNLTRI